MTDKAYLVGSPYYVEDVLGLDPSERAANGVLTHLLLNQPPVCDCRCRRCFMPDWRRDARAEELTSQESCNLIEHARDEGIFCLEVSGEGEPLLSSHLREIVECAFHNGFTTTVITNGHLLTDKIATFFYERNVTLVVSLCSLDERLYEFDNRRPGSFRLTIENIQRAAELFRNGTQVVDGKTTYRMAIHTTAQADNVSELGSMRSYCDEHGIFFSVAPVAPVGGASQHPELLLKRSDQDSAMAAGHNSIILSRTSRKDIGREVCGTCLYGLNVGYDGNVLFDAHAGYEIGGSLGNVRSDSLTELCERQREFAPLLYANIGGFCPVRDPEWPGFLARFLENRSEVFANST